MLTVIADDITGAAEIAGVCLRMGLKVAFSFDTDMPQEVDVWVIATDTRSMSLVEAVQKTKEISSELAQKGILKIYKKVDSALRGHVLPELESLNLALKRQKILLVPVNPDLKRTIQEGQYLIEGVPIHLTSFKDDPDFPAVSSDVQDIVGGTRLKLSSFNENQLEDGYMVPDASSWEDLECLASFIDEDVLPAGGSAFFKAYLKNEYPGKTEAMQTPMNYAGTKLMVCGSTHKNSRDFIGKAKQLGVKVMELPETLMEKQAGEDEIKNWAESFCISIKGQSLSILGIADKKGNAAAIRKNMASTVSHILSQIHINELLIEGGATAYAIISEMGLKVYPCNELRPGVIRMKVEQMKGTCLTIKPGSYHWQDNILQSL